MFGGISLGSCAALVRVANFDVFVVGVGFDIPRPPRLSAEGRDEVVRLDGRPSFLEPPEGSLTAQLDLLGAQGSELPRDTICIAPASGAPDPVARCPQGVRAGCGVALGVHHDCSTFPSAVRLRFGEAMQACAWLAADFAPPQLGVMVHFWNLWFDVPSVSGPSADLVET